MKKILYLALMALPMMLLASACSDDDDTKNIPQVTLSLDYEGGTESQGVLYAVQGDAIDITALRVSPAAGTGDATLGNTTYYMDGVPFYTTGIAPWGCAIDTEGLAVGSHTLTIYSQIFQVGKSIGWGIFEYPLEIVADQADLPGDGSGSGSATVPATQGSGSLSRTASLSVE